MMLRVPCFPGPAVLPMQAGMMRRRTGAPSRSPTPVRRGRDRSSEEGQSMYIAMNRFKVLKDRAKDFENVWFSRESYLHEMAGFVAFHLLKGPEREDHVLYSSHTVWASYADFEAW